jgi:hypothetical protein
MTARKRSKFRLSTLAGFASVEPLKLRVAESGKENLLFEEFHRLKGELP